MDPTSATYDRRAEVEALLAEEERSEQRGC